MDLRGNEKCTGDCSHNGRGCLATASVGLQPLVAHCLKVSSRRHHWFWKRYSTAAAPSGNMLATYRTVDAYGPVGAAGVKDVFLRCVTVCGAR